MNIVAKIAEWRRHRRESRHIIQIASRVAEMAAAGNVIEINESDLSQIYLEIIGTGNVVRVGRLGPSRGGRVIFRVFADNSQIEIASGFSVKDELEVVIGGIHPDMGVIHDSCVKVGKDVTVEPGRFTVSTSHSKLLIGDDCMISYGVSLFHTDAHPIYDDESGRLINSVGTMRIGDHVWIGAKATILKNSVIPDGCIIGFGSVVAGQFHETGVAIAGNPAHIVGNPQRHLRWGRSDAAYYANNFTGF